MLGLVAVSLFAGGRAFAARRDLAVASLLLAAFTAWSFAGIAWAGVKGDAWEGANRTLLYLCVFVLFAWRRIRVGVAAGLLGGFVAVTAGVGLIEFVRAVGAHRPEGFFISGRLSTPISYPNANAALFLAPFFPAVFLASRREVAPLLRGVMLAAAGVLLELAVMCQSRGSLFAFPLTAFLFLALAPGRLRLLLSLALLTVPVAVGMRRLLHVYSAVVDDRGMHTALIHARSIVVWSAVALLLAGVVIGVVDRRLRIPRRATAALGSAVAIAAVVTLVAGTFAFVHRYGSPVHRVALAWRDFKNDKQSATGQHFASGFGSPRYDIWRVAVKEFEHSPLKGVGVDNFAVDYLRLRHTDKEPLYPHSLELRLLAQTGLVGTVLFGGFLVAALLAAGRLWRRSDPLVAGFAAASLAAFVYWLLHGSVDWFWEFPALGAPAFAWLALAGQAARAEATPTSSRVPLYAGLPLLLVSGVAAASLAFPWLSAKEIDTASSGWSVDPNAAFHRLDVARRLDPLTDRADLVAGVIAARLHDRTRERVAFVHALERNPDNWYARLELAVLDAQSRRKAAALAQLRLVSTLNPREPVTAEVRERVVRGKAISQAAVDRLFIERTQTLTGARQR